MCKINETCKNLFTYSALAITEQQQNQSSWNECGIEGVSRFKLEKVVDNKGKKLKHLSLIIIAFKIMESQV